MTISKVTILPVEIEIGEITSGEILEGKVTPYLFNKNILLKLDIQSVRVIPYLTESSYKFLGRSVFSPFQEEIHSFLFPSFWEAGKQN